MAAATGLPQTDNAQQKRAITRSEITRARGYNYCPAPDTTRILLATGSTASTSPLNSRTLDTLSPIADDGQRGCAARRPRHDETGSLLKNRRVVTDLGDVAFRTRDCCRRDDLRHGRGLMRQSA